MCGHVGIVHGGLLATLLDEGMALCGMPALPSRIGVTARLTIDYRKPVRAGTYIVLKAEVVKVEGRKVWVKGRIEGLEEKGGDGELLVEAEALFIQPKYAKVLLPSLHPPSASSPLHQFSNPTPMPMPVPYININMYSPSPNY